MTRSKVEPFPGAGACEPCSGSFDLAASVAAEGRLFQTFAREQVGEIAGTEIEFYVRDFKRSTRDPLYDEPVQIAWIGPYNLKGNIEKPEKTSENIEQGSKSEWDAVAWIPLAAVEEQDMRTPRKGDVCRIWNIPFWNKEGVEGAAVPGSGFYFDVEKAEPDGHIHSEAHFTGFKLMLRRRTEFTPERRISP